MNSANDKLNPAKRHRASATSTVLGQLMMDRIEKLPNDEKPGKVLYRGGNGSWAIGVMYVEGGNVGLENLQHLIQERLCNNMIRFRSRLVVTRSETYFEEVYVDLNHHIQYIYQPDSEAPWSREKLYEYLGLLNGHKYDLDRPLWRFLICPLMDDGTCAVVSCINHAVGDGLAQIDVLYTLLDEPPKFVSSAGKPKDASSMKKKDPNAPKKPRGPQLSTWTRVSTFFGGIVHGLIVPFTTPDKPNSLKLKDSRKPSPIKLLAPTEQIDLDLMKQVKDKYPGATLNDIMMTVMTLTLKAYYKEEGTLSKKTKITGEFPISIRRGKNNKGLKNGEPQNRFSFGYFDFDFECESRTELVWRVKRQIDKIKISPSPLVVDWLSSVMLKILPRRLFLNTVLNASNIGTGQLSNVPGPQEHVRVLGRDVKDMCFFLFSPLGMYFGILSYNGKVSAAVNLDASLGVDPKLIAKHWKVEFDALFQETMAYPSYVPVPKNGCC